MTEFNQPLGNNDDETPIPVPLSAHVKSDERGVLIEVTRGAEIVGEVFVEVFGYELRCYLNDRNNVGGDSASYVLDWWSAEGDDE